MKLFYPLFNKRINLVSKLFQPLNVITKNPGGRLKNEKLSTSQKLMFELGIVRSGTTGAFCILPLGQRSIKKLSDLVDYEMQEIGAQKVILPSLILGELWKQTGRLESARAELFTLTDRHKREYVLSPTHEEAITDLLSSIPNFSYKQLPLRLYQISSKYRDEMKPRFGLLRGREFLMKDLYTFDSSPSEAEKTYQEISECYEKIFNKIGIPFIKVKASNGVIGGRESHEYHYSSRIGEDTLLICQSCNFAVNKDLIIESRNSDECINCGRKTIEETRGIEVGHTFDLGTKYSDPLKASFTSQACGNIFYHMSSFGLGLTRILAASCEVLSNDNELRWPSILAPFQICLIPPKAGSKEYSEGFDLIQQLYTELTSKNEFYDDVIIDDRTKWTIGKRLLEARRMGYPFIIVAGRGVKSYPPVFELIQLDKDEILQQELSFEEIIQLLIHIRKNESQKIQLKAVKYI